MIIVNDVEQGSAEWLKLKLGVISASRAKEFSNQPKLAPLPDDINYRKEDKFHIFEVFEKKYRGTNKSELQTRIREDLPRVYSDTRNAYLCELVGEVITGNIPDEVSFKQCEWGKEHEHKARTCFEFDTGFDVEEVGFIYKDETKRAGISPDGLIKGKKTGLELKCPYCTKVFVDFAVNGKIKPEYYEQCQFSMWVTGYDSWFFANYDPRIKGKRLYYKEINRDEDYMIKYNKAYKSFIRDFDNMLDKLGFKFGIQWEMK